MAISDPRRFSHERWNELINQSYGEIKQLATLKGGEYSGDEDRLANFRRNAEALGLNKETIWAIYATKHWDALMQWIKDRQSGKERVRMESITGRIDDLLVYLLLLKAMVVEEAGKGEIGSIREVSEEELREMRDGSRTVAFSR